MPVRVMVASVPPASITSAWPRRITSVASPRAWLPDAHAVEMQESGPFRPSSIDTWAAAMLPITIGMNSGEARSGPRSATSRVCSTKVASPPMPLPTSAPIRERFASVTARSASSRAIRPAATASWAKRSMRRAVRRSMNSVGSKPRIWQAIVVEVSSGSKR